MDGIMKFVRAGGGKQFVATSKILIIGPSGTGKTVLAFQMAYYAVRRYNRVCYISPQADDDIICAFAKWLDTAGITFEHFIYGLRKDKSSPALPAYDNCLYIVDDYYSSTGRPRDLEVFVSLVINRGRHQGNSIIYNAQAPDRIPHEWWSGFDVCLKIPDEKVFEKVGASFEGNDRWHIKSRYDTIWKELVFKPIHNNRQIIRKLRSKKVKEDRKPATISEYEAIAAQGNQVAEKTYKHQLMACVV